MILLYCLKTGYLKKASQVIGVCSIAEAIGISTSEVYKGTKSLSASLFKSLPMGARIDAEFYETLALIDAIDCNSMVKITRNQTFEL
jgi:hypothetical protein